MNTVQVMRLAQARVLIVDDDPAILQGLCAAFERLGVRPETAANGAQAIKRLTCAMPDLMITDIIMPEREGLETIMAARACAAPGLKIIAISGGGRLDGGEILGFALALGADAVLRKPFRPSQLIALAEELLTEAKAA
ncbi:MAG: response regulator [Brevundimonas sp.]|nr:MAG: response regulator [Brevundimonas sp.]